MNAPNILVRKTTEVYDLQERVWEEGPDMNCARASCVSAVMNSTIYVVGETDITTHNTIVKSGILKLVI